MRREGGSQLVVVTLLTPKVARGAVLGRFLRPGVAAPSALCASQARPDPGVPGSQGPRRCTHLGPKGGRYSLCPPGAGPAAGRRPQRG